MQRFKLALLGKKAILTLYGLSLEKRSAENYIPQGEHSVEEVLERPTGYPKVGGSNHGSGDFSLQPQRNPYLS